MEGTMRKLKFVWNAPVTLSFVLLCIIALVLGYLTGGWTTEHLFMTYRSSLLSLLTYVRFFTHVIGHSGWAHLIGNASYLLLLGPGLEEKYGSDRILCVIILTAFATSLVNFIFFPHVALCGASGVVFAFILLTSFTGFRKGEIPITFILVAVIYLGQQVLDGLFVQDNISNLSHIIGGIVGSIVGWQLNSRR